MCAQAGWVNRISGTLGVHLYDESKPIIGTGGKIFISDAKLDQVSIATADSTAWVVSDDAGVTISSGTLTYIALLPVDDYDTKPGWFANVTWPSTPQRVHVHMTLTKTSVPMKWHFTVDIADFS